ncbi:MAG: AsmA family protein, partial [Bacteroidales bacterium]
MALPSLKKALKLLALTLLLFIVALTIATIVYSPKLKEEAQDLINSSIDGNFHFDRVKLSLLSHLPYISINFLDYSLNSLGNEENPFIEGERVSLTFNPFSILSKRIKVKRIYLKKPTILVLFDRYGQSNFNFIGEDIEDASEGEPFSKIIDFSRLRLVDATILYNDQSTQLSIDAQGANFRGRGSYRESNITLRSKVAVESLSVEYQGIRYIDRKEFGTTLTAIIEANPLRVELKRGALKLSQLEATLTTLIEDHLNGYQLDIELSTGRTPLNRLLSLLPAQYSEWLSTMEFGGESQLALSLSNRNSTLEEFSPTLELSFDLFEGSIKESSFPHPIESLNFFGHLKLPNFNFDSLEVASNSLNFKLGESLSKLKFKIKGLQEPYIYLDGEGALDLALLSGALSIPGFSSEGELDYLLSIDGRWQPQANLFPKGEATIEVRESSLKTPYSSHSIEEAKASLKFENRDGSREAMRVTIEPLEFSFGGAPFYLKGKLENFNKLNYTIVANGSLFVDSLASLFNIESPPLKGRLSGNLYLQGGAASQQIEESVEIGRGELLLQDFRYKSRAMPHAIELSYASLHFNKERAILDRTEVEYGQNRAQLKGYLSNFLNWSLAKGTLNGALEVSSKKLQLDDFTTLSSEPTIGDSTQLDSTSYRVIEFPKDVNLSLKGRVDEVIYNKIKATNFVGEAVIANKSLFINGTGIDIAGAHLLLDATYRATDSKRAVVDLWARADSFDIKRAYREIPLLSDLFSSGA